MIYVLCKGINGKAWKFTTVNLTNCIRCFSNSFTSWKNDLGKGGGEINDEELARLEKIKYIFDLRDPGIFFAKARSMKRHFIFHAGPTNSGKTYHALEEFLRARKAIYCSPLRMLASEIYRKSNDRNVLCDMVTGEERIYAVSKDEPANHVACTVELCRTYEKYDVAVIDEVQMLRDSQRGWAWTQAVLGVAAEEVHLCGEESAVDIVEKLLKKTNDSLEVKRYERMTPLKVLGKAVRNIHKLQHGDCVIAFSQREIYDVRTAIEKSTSLKCAVIYGNLPSVIRVEQAEKFNDGKCDVLIASDAIGMGMNLNIQRIVFTSLEKFNGYNTVTLSPSQTKQIAGRAGRYKSRYETGFVTTLERDDISELKWLMKTSITDIKKAGMLPSFQQLQMLSLTLVDKSLFELLELFELMIDLDKMYFLCDLREMKTISKEIEDVPLVLHDAYTFSLAPVHRSPVVLDVLKKFAWHVAKKRCITDKKVKKFIRWESLFFPRNLTQLQHLEWIHEIFDLYRWLSYRFESLFVHVDEIVELQEELEQIISRAVANNLRYKRRRPSRRFK